MAQGWEDVVSERPAGALSEELANDRTLLAWLRTSISLAGLGFVVAKFALFLQRLGLRPVSHHGVSTAVGVALVLGGGALMMVGYRQYVSVLDALRPKGSEGRPLWPLVVTAASVAGTVMLAVVVIVSNNGSL
jgi:putative membrane protein